MADPFGLDDFSGLSGPQQDTARTVQKAFDASTAGRKRMLERYNLETMGPMMTSFANDAALRRAQTTAGLLNNNQQLQNVIDESHRTPHGFMENFQAYGGALGSLSRLYPALFGTNTALAKDGIIPTAYNAVKQWFTMPDGNKVGLDANGNIVQPSGYDYGTDYGESSYLNSGAFNWNVPAYDWGSGNTYGADFDPNAWDMSSFSDWWA
jgi:hypothetical protein